MLFVVIQSYEVIYILMAVTVGWSVKFMADVVLWGEREPNKWQKRKENGHRHHLSSVLIGYQQVSPRILCRSSGRTRPSSPRLIFLTILSSTQNTQSQKTSQFKHIYSFSSCFHSYDCLQIGCNLNFWHITTFLTRPHGAAGWRHRS